MFIIQIFKIQKTTINNYVQKNNLLDFQSGRIFYSSVSSVLNPSNLMNKTVHFALVFALSVPFNIYIFVKIHSK